MKTRLLPSAMAIAAVALLSPQARAASYTWNIASGGLWSGTGNWNGGVAASGTDATADFNSVNITSDTTVHLDSSVTLQSLIFGDTTTSSAAGWTLDNNGVAGNILTLSGSSIITVNTLGTGKYATISASISGTSGLIKSGSGTLFLTGTNTYTGMTQVTSGVLDIGVISGTGNNSISGSSGIVLTNGAVLEGSGTMTRSLSGSSTASAGQIAAKNGGFAAKGGQLTIKFGNTTNSISLGTGVYQFGDGLVFGSSTADSKVLWLNGIYLNSTGGRTITVNSGLGGDYAEISGVISGTGAGWTKLGTGRLVLSATNTYTDSTTLSAGVLQANDGVGLTTSSYLIINGGVLQSNGTASFTRALSSGSVAGALTFGASGGGFSANGGQLTVNLGGAGSEVVWASTSGANLLGTLMFGSTTADSRTLFVNGIDLNNTTTAATRTINVTSGTGADYAEISGNIRNSGTSGGITLTGNGKLVLSGSNSYNGATTISGGKLVAGSTNALSANSSFTLSNTAGVTLDLAGYSNIVGGLNGGGSIGGNVTLGSGTLTIASTATGSYAGIISGSGGIIKSGAYTQILSGSNIYDGVTTVSGSGSILSITNANALGSTVGNTVVTGSSGNAATLKISGNITVAEALTISGEGSATSGALQNGSGINTWSGAITVGANQARITVASGTLNLTGGVASAGNNLALSNGGVAANALNITTNALNLGSYNLLVGDIGTTTLGVTGNTYGTLILWYGSTLKTTVANALCTTGTLQFGNTSLASGTYGTLTVDLNGYDQTVAALLTSSQVLNQVGSRIITSASAATLTVNQSSSTTFDGSITGAVSLVKSGIGALTLTGTSTYTGATSITGGTLSVNGSLGNTAVTVGSGATLAGTGTANGTVNATGNITGSLTFNSDVTINHGATATASAFKGNITDNGVITSAVALQSGKVLSGSGAVSGNVTVSSATVNGSGLNLGATTLTGSSTLSGVNTASSVTVASGTTSLTGTTKSTSTLSVSAGATLNANGTIDGSASVSGLLKGDSTVTGNLTLTSGTLAPGNSPGITKVQGNFTTDASSTLVAEISGTVVGASYDQVQVSGNVTLAGTLDLSTLSGLTLGNTVVLIDNTGSGTTSGYFATLITSSSTYTLTSNSNYTFTVAGTEYLLSYSSDAGSDGNSNDVTLTVVPEPGTWAILVGGIGMLAFGQRLCRRGVA
ncbi:MAG: beta strand repeat-containing protein [Chthoniobacteraceae bacterium]